MSPLSEFNNSAVRIRDRILKGQVRRVYDEIGDRWTCLILLSMFSGVNSFEGWLTVHGVSPGILSNRLKNLVSAGLLTRRQATDDARRVEYRLTTKGEDLYLWALAVWQWESKWIFRDSPHPSPLFHKDHGPVRDVAFVCEKCGSTVNFYNVANERGPGYGALQPSAGGRARKTRSAAAEDSQQGYQFGRSMDIIGDRWNFLIISASYFGVTRFDDYQRQLRIATNTLANRLTVLTKSGMLAKNRYREAPARYEYILTQKTLDFYQIPLMLALWGDRWLPVKEGDIYIRTHASCGHRLQIKPLCSDCETEIKPGEFRVGRGEEL